MKLVAFLSNYSLLCALFDEKTIKVSAVHFGPNLTLFILRIISERFYRFFFQSFFCLFIKAKIDSLLLANFDLFSYLSALPTPYVQHSRTQRVTWQKSNSFDHPVFKYWFLFVT